MLGLISTGHAKVILGLKHHSVQKTIAGKVIKKGLTVRQTEQEVSAEISSGKESTGKRRKKNEKRGEVDSAVRHIEEQLREYFATQVRVTHGEHKGRIEIEYYGNDDLERVLDLMGVEID